MENNAPFYVGQNIIAIKDHSKSDFKKNDKFIFIGIKEGKCKCGGWVVNVGIKKRYPTMRCPACNTRGIIIDGEYIYYKSTVFAPINPYSNSVSHELAQEAIKERVEVDGPIKILQNN